MAIAPCGPPKRKRTYEQPSTLQGSRARTPSPSSSASWPEHGPNREQPPQKIGVGNCVVGTVISLSLQAFEQPARGAALGFREQAFGSKPGFQRLLERPKPGHRLLFPAIDRLTLSPAMLAH